MAANAYQHQENHRRNTPMVRVNADTGYIENIDEIRQREYPTLNETIYLDHAGTTPYARSFIEEYSKDLTGNLFGNPHSTSSSSQLSAMRINNVRLQILQFFNADPDHFDVVYAANATAAIKLVADAFRDADEGFWFGYHVDAHTSLLGVREYARHGSRCFHSQDEVESWLADLKYSVPCTSSSPLSLFAYPGQSNMTGARHPVAWCRTLRDSDEQSQSQQTEHRKVFSLYDAAALAATSPLDLSNLSNAPDFTAVSFYKIFGFPDLGALIVRKDPAITRIFARRRYFGGGTVELVSPHGTMDHVEKEDSAVWHEKKENLHGMLEDGTLPFHNIIALEHAFITHRRIYGTMGMAVTAQHTRYLANILYDKVHMLRHANGTHVCELYSDALSTSSSGPTIAFNLKDSSGRWIGNSEIERLALVKNIQLRTGSLCNPGGIARHLSLSSKEMRQNFAAGQRCGSGADVLNGKPTGAVRISLGVMSNTTDVRRFLDFINEFFVDRTVPAALPPSSPTTMVPQAQSTHSRKEQAQSTTQPPSFTIESLSVYPIKSCAAFQIPAPQSWEVLPKGLAWDREWCLVHQGTDVALTQKQYPMMVHLRPLLDLRQRKMTVWYRDETCIDISLEETGNLVGGEMKTCATGGTKTRKGFKNSNSLVCGERVLVQLYTDSYISSFFTEVLGVSCTLARYPTSSTNTARHGSIRRPQNTRSSPRSSTDRTPSIKLSNESPILLVSRPSVNCLNEQIKAFASLKPLLPLTTPTKLTCITQSSRSTTITPQTFRPNIVVAQDMPETPYLEDRFVTLTIHSSPPPRSSSSQSDSVEPPPTTTTTTLRSLGPCQRCQMVCIDQVTASRSQEPFVTLAKTRRMRSAGAGGGGVWFGVHFTLDCEHDDDDKDTREDHRGRKWITVGDRVSVTLGEDGDLES